MSCERCRCVLGVLLCVMGLSCKVFRNWRRNSCASASNSVVISYTVDFPNDRLDADQNKLNPYQKLIPLVYRFEVYRSYILSIGSFNPMCGLLGSSPLHSVALVWERLVVIQLFDRPAAMSVRTRMRSKSLGRESIDPPIAII
jgi:hypothetical protein